MELIEIVDRDGNFTGQIMNKEEAHDKNLLYNEVAVFIINDKREVLLQKRSATKRFSPNKWSLCAGHVDAGESLEDAALRELKEEVGIDITASDLVPFAERNFSIKDSNSHVTYFYYIKSNLNERDFIIQKEELSEVKWFSIDKIVDMIKSVDNPTTFYESKIGLFEKLRNVNL